jgi:hypothetical protein
MRIDPLKKTTLAVLVVLLVAGVFLQAETPTTAQDAQQTVSLAYRYALPVYELARLRYQQSFNPANPKRLPLNTLQHARQLADHNSRAVTAPNNDTLYSNANLDLRSGPVRIDVPEFGSRYYSIALVDAFTNNFAYIGKRATGSHAGSYLVAGPGWKGDVPAEVHLIHAPTPDVFLLVRILVDGPEDLEAVHKLQDAIVLTGPALNTNANAPIAPIANDGPNFVAVVNQTLRDNLPPAQDAAILAKISSVGLWPGDTALSAENEAIWKSTFAQAQAELRNVKRPSQLVNGWSYLPAEIGDFGRNYDLRAAVALSVLLALTPEEATYGSAVLDAKGEKLDGTRRYRIHVPKELPVDAFWSISIYEVEPDGRVFFADNPIHRYAIGDRTRGLKRNSDGSIDILVQREKPAEDQLANWLPAPASGHAHLILRLYQPRAEILNGSFAFPALERLDFGSGKSIH